MAKDDIKLYWVSNDDYSNCSVCEKNLADVRMFVPGAGSTFFCGACLKILRSVHMEGHTNEHKIT